MRFIMAILSKNIFIINYEEYEEHSETETIFFDILLSSLRSLCLCSEILWGSSLILVT
ncbi:MAG: hypothetical protein HUU50_15870 [Candidatus Brocadiae bacterium]|nr:hypothetical protein [Candidatus Brocadiia bacterium]